MKVLWNTATGGQEVSNFAGLERRTRERERTEDDDNNDADHEEEDLVKDTQSLTDILHAVGNGLALLADIDNLENHLLEGNVAVLVGVDGGEGLLGVVLVGRSQDLQDVVDRQGVAALDDEGHPDAAGQGLGRPQLLEGLDDDGVGRVGVEDLLAGDLGGDVAEDGGDLVAEAADVADQAHGGDGTSPPVTQLAAGELHIDTIVNDVVLVHELGAVHGEQRARSVIQETQEVDLALGVLDAVGEGALVVRDADQLDDGLLDKQDGRREVQREQDALDGIDPLDVVVGEEELEGEPRGEAPEEQREGDLESPEHGGVLPRAGADDTAEEHEDGREQLGAELSDPQGQPRDLDPDEQHEQARSFDGGIVGSGVIAERDAVLGRRVGLGVLGGAGDGQDDEGYGQQGGDGDDVDEIARDDGEGNDLVVEAAHGVQGHFVVGAAGSMAGQVLVAAPATGGVVAVVPPKEASLLVAIVALAQADGLEGLVRSSRARAGITADGGQRNLCLGAVCVAGGVPAERHESHPGRRSRRPQRH